jgi:L-lactate dehydrogenase complex protein LldF
MQVASMYFKERAHVKLHDAQLQYNLRKIKGKFVEKRRASLGELDDFEGTREVARAIRQRALDDLDVWLTIFEENARARGATVLFAETGSVVVVTNEGNATLTTTLPKVHIAISGIEKIVPTLEDVATLMRLLPRSATGQSISNYVDILTGVKGAGEFHGVEHMYFIVVDSGRSAILGSDVKDALRCIRCGACMNHCPVYQNVGGHSYGWVYPGPIGSVLTPMYVGLENALDLPHASTMCNQCGVVCPVKIPLPDLQRKLREKEFDRRLRPWYERAGLRAWAWLALHPRLYAVATRVGVRGLRLLADRNGMLHELPLASGWTDERDMPAPAGRTFRELYAARRNDRAAQPASMEGAR